MKQTITVFWFRRDLRLDDNVGFYEALKGDTPVLPFFIFDTEIIDTLPEDDARITFIFDTLQTLRKTLQNENESSLAIYKGTPESIFKSLLETYTIGTVFTNRDYEPYAKERDAAIENLLKSRDVDFKTFKDHVIFEKDEITKSNGTPYLVYTPYMKRWRETFKNIDLNLYDTKEYLDNLVKNTQLPNLTLTDIGFKKAQQTISPYNVTPSLIEEYESKRNHPALDATSRIGPHLRFGTVSIRKILKKTISEQNDTFWKELIWREFFIQILYHFPKTTTNAFKPKYDRIEWRNNAAEFKKWCDGKTGYPLVDAGMRELNTTGFMHNRVRMLVGSFLCKHLLIDWRWGEAFFAEKLHDYEMASNVGNWQWVAGTGVDAAPYFRIFNPTTQIKKFDKAYKYIRKWVPDYQETTYPEPMVDHKEARKRCINTYKAALS